MLMYMARHGDRPTLFGMTKYEKLCNLLCLRADLQVLSTSDTAAKDLPAIMGMIAATFCAMVNIKRKDGTR